MNEHGLGLHRGVQTDLHASRSNVRTVMLKWGQQAVIYEIAPVSFQGSNGDGRGDLPGLLSRIDYLEWLGVDAIWLTPIYRSPMLDLGYDIADFCAIDPLFGTLEDFDRLVDILHARTMRLILDFVPNHHVGPASLVRGEPLITLQSQTQLVCVGRSGPRRGTAEQLAERFRRQRLAVGREDRTVLLPLVSHRAARPQLAQPGGAVHHG